MATRPLATYWRLVELPTGAQFVKTSKNGAYDKNRNAVQWSIGALRPGAQQVVEVIAVVNGSGQSRLDARASAKLDQLTASDSAVTAVEALADLRLTVVDPVGPVALDTEVAYEVVIENRGTKAAKDIDVVGYFSEGIEPVAVKGWQGTVSIGEVRLESIPQVSPGQRLVIKVIAEASREGNHVFRAELASHDPSTKTKLAVEEWTVFHADSDPLDEPVQQADKTDGYFLRAHSALVWSSYYERQSLRQSSNSHNTSGRVQRRCRVIRTFVFFNAMARTN